MSWLRRLWPDRIAARIALAILVAIGSAQLVSVLVFILLHPGPPAVYGLGDVVSATRRAVDSARLGKSADAIENDIGGDFEVEIESSAPPQEPVPRFMRRLMFALRDALPPDVEVRVERRPPDDFTRFFGVTGSPRAFVPPPPPPAPDQQGPRDRLEPGELSVGGWFAIHVAVADNRWVVLRPPGTPGARHALMVGILWLGLIGAAVAAVAVMTGRRIVAPLEALVVATRRFARERQATPVPPRGPQELREITDAFNETPRDLTRYIDERTRIAAALAHDLRTPLTRLRLALEREAPDDRAVMLAAIERMAGMIDATLAYARQDSAREAEQRVDLAALAQSVCDDMADLGFDAAYEGPARMVVRAQPSSLRRAVANLVENACRHGGNALASIEMAERQVRLVIADDGPGIPPEQRELAFEPFRRLDEARTGDTTGTGLGLALARAIARSHGGDVMLEDRLPHGLRAVLALPVQSTAA